MKYLLRLTILVFAILFQGCVNHIDDDNEENAETKNILFKTSMHVSQSPMRSVISDNISKIIVADFVNGIETQKIQQVSTDANFGQLSIPLKYGTHELLFVGHNAESCTLSYPSVSFEKPMDTFSFYKELAVDENTEETQNIELIRSAALVKLTANDAIPAEVAMLKITFSKYYPSLNIKTALANGDPVPVERTFEYKTAHIGVKGSTYSIYTFAPDGGYATDVTIATIDTKGNTLNSTTARNVSVDKNCQTKISGNVFHSGFGVNLTVVTEWKDDIIVPLQ